MGILVANLMNDYLNKIAYTEEDLQTLSDEKFNKVYDMYFNNEEFLKLEKEYMDTYEILEFQQISIQPKIAPILIPIAAAAARIALQTIVKQGTKIASKYLKNKLKLVGKNYRLIWNSINQNNKVTFLLKIQINQQNK